ncbi:MAG: tetratricopeptide repeat protein [Phycisphaerales bacterium JB041]
MKRSRNTSRPGQIARAGAIGFGAASLVLGVAGCERPLSQVRAGANQYYFDGMYADAQPLYQEIVDRRPGDARSNYELGRNLLAMGQTTEARERMILAYNLEPSNETYFEGMADALAAAGNEDDLFDALEHRIADRGGVADYIMLGRYAQRIGKADEAERAFLSAAEIDGGESVTPQKTLAEFYRSIGDTDAEVRRLRMMLWFDRQDAAVNSRLRELGQIPGPTFALPPAGR